MNAKMIKLWGIIIILTAVICQAAPITIGITGNVTYIGGTGVPGTIYEGVTFTGTYTYESSTDDSGGGHYVHNAPYGINLSMGGYKFKTVPNHVGQFVISILDNYAPYGNIHDDYWVKSYENLPLSDGTVIDSINWTLLDGSCTALSSSDLPVTAPVLSDWNMNDLRIYGPEDVFLIRGTVTQTVLVPEPAIVVLMIMGISLYRRRR